MKTFDEDLWWEKFGRPFTDDEIECYKLWFDFLKLSDRNKWSESVVQDFGDVSGDFDSWWESHNYLFQKMKHHTITEVLTDEDFQACKANACTDEFPGTIVLAVPLYETKEALRAAFDEILTTRHKGKAGLPAFDDWADVYRFANRPNSDVLDKILKVYKLVMSNMQKPKAERVPQWKIEEELNLIKKTKQEKAKYIWIQEANPEVIKKRQKSQSNTVSKYFKYAEEILENVVKGEFPVFTVK